MRFNRAAVALMLIATAGLGACSDDDDDDGLTAVVVADFKGTWDANSIRYTSKADASKSFDIVNAGGDLVMNIAADGSFNGEFKLPNPQGGIAKIPMSGKITITGNNQAHVDLTWPTQQLQDNPPVTDFDATFTLSANALQFRRDPTSFTFPTTPSQTNEASILVISMVRTSA